MPDVRLINTMKYQVCETYRKDVIIFLAAIKGAALERSHLIGVGVCRLQALECLREKSASTTRGIVDSLADLRVDYFNHRSNNLAWREELPAVVPLLAHLEQQALKYLRERKDVRGVNVLLADLMHLVHYVEQVLFRINADALNA